MTKSITSSLCCSVFGFMLVLDRFVPLFTHSLFLFVCNVCQCVKHVSITLLVNEVHVELGVRVRLSWDLYHSWRMDAQGLKYWYVSQYVGSIGYF